LQERVPKDSHQLIGELDLFQLVDEAADVFDFF